MGLRSGKTFVMCRPPYFLDILKFRIPQNLAKINMERNCYFWVFFFGKEKNTINFEYVSVYSCTVCQEILRSAPLGP